MPIHNWDATKTEAPPELLQRGFELAYFLAPDRSTAIEILRRAMEKLRVRSRRELKRLYWRDKHAERPVRRIARNDADMLQWLIMFEAEQDETVQERADTPSSVNMAIRYIKHLVQITTALSSFYVNIGITRLLHDYSTSEAQRIYETLTSRFLGPDEYRRAKSFLMEKMRQRFGSFLKIARVDHGELRFETAQDQERWTGVVRNCLQAFAPWSTQQDGTHFMAANGAEKESQTSHSMFISDQNENELRCCHILIEPTSYSRLMEDLAFDPPDTRLALPRFVMPEKQENNGDSNTQQSPPPELSREDIDEIQRRLAISDVRRRNSNLRNATLFIDGVEQMQIDLTAKSQLQIALEAGNSLVELRGADESGELCLATHVISYTSNAIDYSEASTTLSTGKLKFAVTPIASVGQGPVRSILSIGVEPRLNWTRLLSWREIGVRRSAVHKYVLAGLAMAVIGAGVTGAIFSHKLKLLEEELQQAQNTPHPLLPAEARAIISYNLIRDDQRVRGSETAPVPEISLRLHSPAISFELPVSQNTQAQTYSAELKTFAGDQTLMAQNFLRPVRTDGGAVVEIIVPANLLAANTYYTVNLHSADRTDRFTFKVVDIR